MNFTGFPVLPHPIVLRGGSREKWTLSSKASVNNLRIYTHLSIRTSDSKFNLSRWKSTCYYSKQMLIFFQNFNLSMRAMVEWTSVKIFTAVERKNVFRGPINIVNETAVQIIMYITRLQISFSDFLQFSWPGSRNDRYYDFFSVFACGEWY